MASEQLYLGSNHQKPTSLMMRADAPVFVPTTTFEGGEGCSHGSYRGNAAKKTSSTINNQKGTTDSSSIAHQKSKTKEKNLGRRHRRRRHEQQQNHQTLQQSQEQNPRQDDATGTARRNKHKVNNRRQQVCRPRRDGREEPGDCNSKTWRTLASIQKTLDQDQGRQLQPQDTTINMLPISAFPELRSSDATNKTHSSSSKTTDHEWSFRTWEKQPRILLQQDLHDSINGIPEINPSNNQKADSSWTKGLDKLTTTTAATTIISGNISVAKRQTKIVFSGSDHLEFSPWEEAEISDGSVDAATDDCTSAEPSNVKVEKENQAYKEDGTQDLFNTGPIIEPSSGLRRPRINMDRLRDRWWNVLAQQRLHNSLLEELKAELQHRRMEEVDVPSHSDGMEIDAVGNGVGCDDADRKDETIHDSRVSDGENKEAGDAPHLNSQIVPRYGSLSSRKHLVDCMVEKDDDMALEAMFKMTWDESIDENSSCEEGCYENLVDYAMEKAATRDRPRILRTILSLGGGSCIYSNILMQATELGHEECVSILLSKQDQGTILLFDKDQHGNNALHYCCRGRGKESLLRLLLQQVTGTTKGKQQQLAKLVSAKNDNLQTPFHVACGSGRVDFVEIFLSICGSTLLSKILLMKDVDDQTPLLTAVASNAGDVVISLIMWRGNHSIAPRKAPIYSSPSSCGSCNNICKRGKTISHSCPLVWAAKNGNVDMMDLLLQFGDQSGLSYRLTEALIALLQSDAHIEIKLEAAELLVCAGANPFEEIAPCNIDGDTETAVCVASKTGIPCVLRSIVSTGRKMLVNRQLARRRDPKLQQQPESFFSGLELKENVDVKNAVTDALILSLFHGHSKQRFDGFVSASVLYEEGCELDQKDLSKLQLSMTMGKLTPRISGTTDHCLMAVYDHFIGFSLTEETTRLNNWEFDRTQLAHLSFLLFEMSWTEVRTNSNRCFCSWMKDNEGITKIQSIATQDVILIAEDGCRFSVHSSVISRKSAKLESAIRFAQMSANDESVVEVCVPISSQMLQHMIEKAYHGSMFLWPDLSDVALSQYLLELVLVCEEYLFQDLVQEIEMRLLSSEPKECFCLFCCRAVRPYHSPHDSKITTVQCMYCVDTNSRLLSEKTIFDVMGVAFYLESLDYEIYLVPMNLKIAKCSQPIRLWASYDGENSNISNGVWISNKALATLKDSINLMILKRFAQISKSPAFLQSIDCPVEESGNHECESQHRVLLLQLCMNNLGSNSLIAAPESAKIKLLDKHVEETRSSNSSEIQSR